MLSPYIHVILRVDLEEDPGPRVRVTRVVTDVGVPRGIELDLCDMSTLLELSVDLTYECGEVCTILLKEPLVSSRSLNLEDLRILTAIRVDVWILPRRELPRFVGRLIRITASLPKTMKPVEAFRSCRECGIAPLVSMSRAHESLPGILLMLRGFRHKGKVELLTNQILRVICRATFDPCTPRDLNVHFPRALVIRLLNPLVAAELHLQNEEIPKNPKLLFCQVIRWSYDPSASLRDHQSRSLIHRRHPGLAKPSAADRDAEACL